MDQSCGRKGKMAESRRKIKPTRPLNVAKG